MSIKGPFYNPEVVVEINSPGSSYKIVSRASTILPQHINKKILVHNGKEFKSFGKVTMDHVGRKFGEFSPTKMPAVYKRAKKK